MTPREKVLAEIQDELSGQLIASGARAETIRIADIEETAISYMADESTKLRVKLVGDLAFSGDDEGGNP